MDTLTHALSGALLARATAPKDAPPRSLPRRIAAGFFACAAPDLDFVIGFVGPVEYLMLHRGPTHSIFLLPLWALLFSWVLAKILREPRGWRALYGVTAMGIGLHIAGDLITSFGTIMLWPLADWRLGLGTTFIIDLWFSGIILAGLLACLFFRKSRVPSGIAAAVLAGYVGFQAVLKDRAVEVGVRYAQSRGITEPDVAAHPRPVSPYNWTVFVSDQKQHHYAHVNLLRDEPRSYKAGDGFVAKLDSAYRPVATAAWETRSRYGEGEAGKEAWDSPALGFMRWFAERPAFDGATADPQCAWFLDLRFVNPGRDWVPFRFGACR
ncbi:MAG: metal-dependent hydrolase, partial [Candidatus Parcubacteria bacterium]|nr:metal-dependent hydrolase [Burkholderiales bacterium]